MNEIPRTANGWPTVEPNFFTLEQLIEEAERWRGCGDNPNTVGQSNWRKYTDELFFPLHPVGASRSTTDIYWVRIADLQTNAEELTSQEMFDKTAQSILPAVKANIDKLKALARQKLEVAKKYEWEPVAMEQAFEDFSMEAEEIIPDLDQTNELHDEVWQFIETNIFNAVAKELGATDEDLEV